MKTNNCNRIRVFSFQKRTTVTKIHGSDANLPLDGPRDPIFIDLGCISCFFVNLSEDFSYTFHLHFHMCFLLFSFLSVGLQGNIRKARPQRKQYSQIVVGAAMTRRRRLQENALYAIWAIPAWALARVSRTGPGTGP